MKSPQLLNPGDLCHRVVFLVPPSTFDSAGGELPLVDGQSTWASINFVTGRSQFGGAAFVAEATHRISMRYRAGVLPEWQLRFEATNFKILYIDNVQQAGVRLDLYCVILDGVS